MINSTNLKPVAHLKPKFDPNFDPIIPLEIEMFSTSAAEVEHHERLNSSAVADDISEQVFKTSAGQWDRVLNNLG